MTKQTINVGQIANDKTGDPLRVAFAKANANFNELYNAIDEIEIGSGGVGEGAPPKEWTNPETESVWSIVDLTGGIRVFTNEPELDDVETEVAISFSGTTLYVPRDSTTERIQEYWNGQVEGGYRTQIMIINGEEYTGFTSTFDSTGWRIILNSPATAEAGDPVTVRYVKFPAPVKWFDAADYPNSENFLSAKITYYAYVEGRGQETGTVWFTGTHDEYNDFRANSESSRSGNYTDLEMDRRPSSQSPFTSLWLSTNSVDAEPISIMWEAKMFYGAGGIFTPEITGDD